MKTHAAADIFPLMDRAELERLEDIRVNGLREPITLHLDGSILDGRNRERACAVAGVEPRFVEWDGEGGGFRAVDESAPPPPQRKIALWNSGPLPPKVSRSGKPIPPDWPRRRKSWLPDSG